MLELLLTIFSAKYIFKFCVQFFVASLGYNKKYIGFIGYLLIEYKSIYAVGTAALT
jgi:hypothetical protein